jgi:hypothetical protein
MGHGFWLIWGWIHGLSLVNGEVVIVDLGDGLRLKRWL